MKKMKFLAFMLSAAFLATTFTACDDDDDDVDPFVINITTPTETIYEGVEFNVHYDVKTKEKLESIEVWRDNEAVYNVPKKEFDSKYVYVGDYTAIIPAAGTYKFTLKVKDKKGNEENKNFELVVVAETTALGEWSEEVRLKRPEAEGFKAESGLINLKWTSNVTTGDLAFAAINVSTLSGSAVLVDNADFETVEGLVEAYEAGDKVSTFVIKTDAKYEAVNYITIVGDDYVLVKTSKKVTLNDGNNDAYFQYKK